MPAGTLTDVVICVASAYQASPCPAGQAPTVISAYLISPGSASVFDTLVDSQDVLNLLLTGGFSSEAAELGFYGVLLMFATGLAIGIIANLVRKART
ncbi:MAG: hypothetical protein WC091_07170 [Sulfuricellaceae bacterium]